MNDAAADTPSLGVTTVDQSNLERAVAIITSAFHDDPVWSWAFDDEARRPAHFTRWWRFWVGAATRYPWVLMTAGAESCALWIPPNGVEATPDEAAHEEPMLRDMIGDRAAIVMDAIDRFESHHPRDEPHFYLSLFGTHATHRGRGIGMQLLRENLSRIDAQHMPAYLESSNPANVERYRSVGFEVVGSFSLPEGAPDVAMMWRPAR